jgi:hypothetical protein
MFLNSTRLRISVVFLIILFPFASLSANSFKDNLHLAGLASIFVFAADNGVDSDPMPIIPSLGVSAAWQFLKYLRLELSEDIYIQNYEFNSALGYPMACNPENRSALVIGLFTGVQLTGAFPISKNGALVRIYGGPAADLRIVVLAVGLNHPDDFTGDIKTDAQLQTDAIRDYFWSGARWFMPTAGLGMDFPLTEKILLGFDLRAWFPVYKLWTDDKTPVIDGWRFGVGLRITPRNTTQSGEAIHGASK